MIWDSTQLTFHRKSSILDRTNLRQWSNDSTVSRDWSLQQLAPYIGRMKTDMARALILAVTKPGDLVVDPFCGSGVIPLEAISLDRRIAAGDWNPYAVTLTRAKLFPPASLQEAMARLEVLWKYSGSLTDRQDLRSVPGWVRSFFHSETLRNALAFRDACVAHADHFMLACLLSILHHQRPGFLSFPSSHLVPYLRDRKFPKVQFPTLYEERDVKPRLVAKLHRVFKRMPDSLRRDSEVFHCDARDFPHTRGIQAVITSPPYMNELDYVRDNRLRLWFIQRSLPFDIEPAAMRHAEFYENFMSDVCCRLSTMMRPHGSFVLVVGDASRPCRMDTAALVKRVFARNQALKRYRLVDESKDTVPDIRRSRRECRGTKEETILFYRRF